MWRCSKRLPFAKWMESWTEIFPIQIVLESKKNNDAFNKEKTVLNIQYLGQKAYLSVAWVNSLWFFSMKQSQPRMIYIFTSAEGHVRPQRSLYVASFPLVLYHLSHTFFLSSKERLGVKRTLLFCPLRGFILFCLIKKGGKLQARLQWSLS